MAVVKRRFAGFMRLEGEGGWFNTLGIWMDFDVIWRIGKMARSLFGASTTLGAIIRAHLSKFPSCTLDAQKWDFTSSFLNIHELPSIPPSKWVPCWQLIEKSWTSTTISAGSKLHSAVGNHVSSSI